MSSPNNPHESFPGKDPSGDFGRDEGVYGYALLASIFPDTMTTEQLAELSVQLQLNVEGRLDIDPRRATEAVLDKIDPLLGEM